MRQAPARRRRSRSCEQRSNSAGIETCTYETKITIKSCWLYTELRNKVCIYAQYVRDLLFVRGAIVGPALTRSRWWTSKGSQSYVRIGNRSWIEPACVHDRAVVVGG